MHVFKGQQVDEKLVEQLDTIKQKLVKTDSNILLSGVNDLSKVRNKNKKFSHFFFKLNIAWKSCCAKWFQAMSN
jgi:hypothetical protein